MSEIGAHTPEHLATEVWRTENEFEEGLREAFLADKLVGFKHLLAENKSVSDEEYIESLKREFLGEKRGLNMGEVFALAMSDKYRGKLFVVELGKTTHPEAEGEIDMLKGDYLHFKDWASRQDPEDIHVKELSRDKSGREVEYRLPRLENARGKSMVLVRKRILMVGQVNHAGDLADMAIFKRMAFSVPLTTFYALQNGDTDKGQTRFSDERRLQIIETMLQHGTGGVKPIRTAYYLATDF